jgi:hypothetical protein
MVYFLFMILGIYGEFGFPSFLVSGDAASTAANISRSEFTYRAGILLGFVTHVVFIYLVVVLFQLLEEVDRGQALLMVLLVAIGVAVALSNMLARFAPLMLLNAGDSMAAFSKSQLDALALSSIQFRRAGAVVPLGFWGLWLLPFGRLVMKSGFLPRILGVLLMVAGFAYIAGSTVAILVPEYRQLAGRSLTPLYLGEVPVIFWLLLKGTSTQS